MFKQLHVSTTLTGKMKGITGISTYFGACKFCKTMQKNAKDNCICKYCYAKSVETMKLNKSIDYFKKNTAILSEHMYRSEIPNLIYNHAGTNLARFDTHGEMPNLECLVNFCKIARANSMFRFALWTKRIDLLIESAEEGIIIPKNICLVVSSYNINEELPKEQIERLQKAGVHIDTIFTVYSDKYIKEHDIKINCGNRNCAQCMKCYTHHKQIKYINEILKGVNQDKLDF